ncbi:MULTISPECIES: hypothetical protein [unclassified Brevundimonas]|uniref:hypothetical protein n=1 Tax=unclassified Brevundimonas TaxID=2622653 RepID=UPI000C48F691|nr:MULTISPECIES: hypothetical protein [unclassified Brevundimonas]MAL89848.1 hypothetical protein [Brevundimonas sp.]HAJ01666.1 hypothetical protein [Brevundimonas sp.]
MDRRHLLSLIGAGLGMGVAGPALAGGDEKPAAAVVNLQGVGLPVISGGRIRNYVFVSIRLHLSASAVMETVRAKDAHFRDALVKAAHRTPFTLADDWSQLDTAALSRSLMASATRIAGQGKVARVEVLHQAPRRRTGIPTG